MSKQTMGALKVIARREILWILPHTVHLADIGGGRGDLANAVAAQFAQPRVQQQIAARVAVIDNNGSSLAAEIKRALANNFDKHISCVLCDLTKEEKMDEVLGDAGRFDLVFGLHCYRGLAETAVELALRSNQYSGAVVAFCVSTCCYLSNTHLVSLTVHVALGLTWSSVSTATGVW